MPDLYYDSIAATMAVVSPVATSASGTITSADPTGVSGGSGGSGGVGGGNGGGGRRQEDRTRAEHRLFRRALFEMTRLYAFHECEVIILPNLDSTTDAWGRQNQRKYGSRG